jgi:hypothetical protein
MLIDGCVWLDIVTMQAIFPGEERRLGSDYPSLLDSVGMELFSESGLCPFLITSDIAMSIKPDRISRCAAL